MSEEIKYYPLNASQKVITLSERLVGQTYSNLCIMINYEQDDIDPEIMEKAVNLAIDRCPSTRLRRHDFKDGKKKIIKQYFVEEPETKCECVSFKSDDKMYKYINKLVRKPFPNKYQDCDLYKIYLVKKADGRYSLLTCFYHFIADAYAIIKFFNDVTDIYKALKTNTEMPEPFLPLLPAYQEVWDYETSEKRQKDIEFWKEFYRSRPAPQFATLNGFKNKYTYIPGKKYGNSVSIFNTKAVQTNYKISKELNEKVDAFAIQNGFSSKVIYMLGVKNWLSLNTDMTEEFLFQNLSANRTKKKFAKTGGTFADNLPLYLDAKNSMTFLEACRYTAETEYQIMKHGQSLQEDFNPFIEESIGLDKMIDKGWILGSSGIIFTYQPFLSRESYLKTSTERFTSGKSPAPIYMTIMPADNYSGEMNINYEYLTKIHKEEDIAEFHNYLIKFLDKATSNPEMTLTELMNV